MRCWSPLVIVVALLWQAPSHATLLVINANNFAAGTDVSNAFAGISLSTQSCNSLAGEAVITTTPVYSRDSAGHTITGTNGFANDLYPYGPTPGMQWAGVGGCGIGDGDPPSIELRVDLHGLRLQSVTTIWTGLSYAGALPMDGLGIIAYDSGDRPVAQCGSPAPVGLYPNCAFIGLGRPPDQTYAGVLTQFSFGGYQDIAWLALGASSTRSNPAFLESLILDVIPVEVPEPATLSLLAAGLLGLIASRRRRSSHN